MLDDFQDEMVLDGLQDEMLLEDLKEVADVVVLLLIIGMAKAELAKAATRIENEACMMLIAENIRLTKLEEM